MLEEEEGREEGKEEQECQEQQVQEDDEEGPATTILVRLRVKLSKQIVHEHQATKK